MKRTLLFITCMMTFMMMFAQVASDEYRPLVVEGKHWTYDNFMPLRPAEYDHYYYYDLKGDTLIAGKNCLKMYSDNRNDDSIVRYEGALYEENKKVYCFFSGKKEAVLLYDFDCKVGDIVYVNEGQMVVKDIRIENNGGISIKKYILHSFEMNPNLDDEMNDYAEVSWIEGVGATKDFFGMLPLPGNYNTLNACELNGEKLYQWIEPEYTDEGYHKMAIEGKRWNYIHYYFDEDGEHRDPYSYVVRGDTIIRRTTYKKLWYQDEKIEKFVCLLFEEGRTVYKNTDLGNNSYDSPILNPFFYFNRDDFGRVFTWKAQNTPGNTNWMPYGVDTIEVKGQPFRRYTCLQKYSGEGEELSTIDYNGEGVWHDIWVEGVGSASSGIEDQYPSHEPPEMASGDYTYFVSCYENGECIFTADDFNRQTKPVYRPFIEDGKVWKVGSLTTGNPVQLVDYYYFDGDTIIDGKSCKQMMCQRYVNPDYAVNHNISQDNSLSYVGAWYEEDQKVYFCNTTDQQFRLMYDFSLEDNGTFLINGLSYVVGPRQTGGMKGFKGVYRDVRQWADGESIYSVPWLEGVGGTDRPMTNVYFGYESYADPLWFLMACAVDDEVIYLNDACEDGATPENLGAQKRRFDFTHTTKLQPKVPTRRGEEQTIYAEYNAFQLGVNLEPIDDAYMVRITDETGKVVYDKAINAGSIVGLNIDISNYAKGRYTVTVENSQEVFTGEFEAQATGIEEVNLTPALSKGEGAIFNLQGQRLSSLQKGLNIVNGQKIFVK